MRIISTDRFFSRGREKDYSLHGGIVLSFFKARCDSRGRGDFDAVDSDRKREEREREKEDILSLDFGWLIRIFSVSIRVRKSVLSASNPRPRVGGTGFVHACDTRLGVCRTRCTYESGTSSF